ncbi:unnamed protein product [Acanthoscelides obtectus]|uniref:UBC core domain-containing protein n=1 Tax=Acanthoscelides obtectus TaxID=200917 RepID=A0A9P0M3S2_ACAOB|nr:unnamed protein product [Acanthoscelides obtectus]CAK1636084.1 AKT-interacting protein [Acanthoscelides obtectus]
MYGSASPVKGLHNQNGNFQRTGSIRKVIPSDTSKEIISEKQNETVDKLYKTYRQEYVILAEYEMVQLENITGVYVIPSKESSVVWFGVIFVRSGFYEDGVFRFTILLNEEFPDAGHPKVIFHSHIFHPVIEAQSRELYLLKAFPKWNKAEQHLWQVLKYIQWIFYNVECSIEHTINEEAAEMFKNDLAQFKSKCLESVKSASEHLYDLPPTEDPHYITFEPYDPEVHDKVRESMLTVKESKPSKRGLSWVLPGSYKPLTRPATPPSESEL